MWTENDDIDSMRDSSAVSTLSRLEFRISFLELRLSFPETQAFLELLERLISAWCCCDGDSIDRWSLLMIMIILIGELLVEIGGVHSREL